jgi:glucose/arabinose dehydrogenase
LKSQDVRRIDLNDAANVTGQSALRIGQRARDVRQGPDGMLYVITDKSNGRLVHLEPASDKESPDVTI